MWNVSALRQTCHTTLLRKAFVVSLTDTRLVWSADDLPHSSMVLMLALWDNQRRILCTVRRSNSGPSRGWEIHGLLVDPSRRVKSAPPEARPSERIQEVPHVQHGYATSKQAQAGTIALTASYTRHPVFAIFQQHISLVAGNSRSDVLPYSSRTYGRVRERHRQGTAFAMEVVEALASPTAAGRTHLARMFLTTAPRHHPGDDSPSPAPSVCWDHAAAGRHRSA